MPILYTTSAGIDQLTIKSRLFVSTSIEFRTNGLTIDGQLSHGLNNLLPNIASYLPSNASVFGVSNHAEGFQTIMTFGGQSNRGMHSEGYLTRITNGNGGHAEGFATLCSSPNEGQHAEGIGTTTVGNQGAFGYQRYALHAEGSGSYIQSSYSHVEGGGNRVGHGSIASPSFGSVNHMEGFSNDAFSTTTGGARAAFVHYEGAFNTNRATDFRGPVHVEGMYNTGSGEDGSHIEGAFNNRSSINNMAAFHIEGMNNDLAAASSFAHIEGYACIGNAVYSHTEGYQNINSSSYGHVGGYLNNSNKNPLPVVTSNYIFVAGIGNCDTNVTGSIGGFYVGNYNTSSGAVISPLLRPSLNIAVGGGVNDTQRSNIFEVLGYNNNSFTTTYVSRSILLPGVVSSGPYSDDASAAAGGVPLHGVYRLNDGIQNNILQIRVS
jgi:hypothetical protein